MRKTVAASVCLGMVLSLAAWAAGCRRSPGQAAAPGAKVARIVFVDKQNACKCTRDRTDASWEALRIALGNGSKIPVERLHLDTQSDRAEPYEKMKPVMVIPAVYFLDNRGKLVGMLQGELKPEQIAGLLDKK